MPRVLPTLFLLVLASSAVAGEARPARYGGGTGPVLEEGTYRLLDEARTPGQSNAVAFDLGEAVASASMTLECEMRVLEGGDGGAFLFLNAAEYGEAGPAPFLKSWVEPNLAKTFAVGIDVHNPPIDVESDRANWFNEWGNYQGNPQREVSLHWDGRELVKRVAPNEFRGEFVPVRIHVEHVVGGAEVTVEIAGALVYDRTFVAGMQPYPARLAVGAGTRSDATTLFDVREVSFLRGEAAAPRRPPLHVEVFNHVLTDNSKTSYQKTVALPPPEWAFGRVILTLDIHDAGPDWDEWDRCGEVYVVLPDGTKRGIVPFITSYRTPCHWKVDVTHFRPLLSGETTLEIHAGTTFYKNRGYMMSVALDFHHGTPALEPFDVIPLWHGTAKYGSAENHFRDFFESRSVEVPEDCTAARIFTTTTGHSQIGEFVPSRRAIAVAAEGAEEGGETRFENVLWKDDCYLNPNRPQFGTWKFARAGWAPGDVVHPWWIDLTPHVQPGQRLEVRYEPEPYDFSGESQAPPQEEVNKASHIVRSYLVLYREPSQLVPAPSVLVTGVSDGSNAARAGMKQGDYLAAYDGKRVDTMDELRAALKAAAEGGKEKVSVLIYRGSERLELELEPGQMGVNLSAPTN